MIFPCGYILVGDNCDNTTTINFIKDVLDTKVIVDKLDEYTVIYYSYTENDLLEALDSFKNEGFVDLKIYCSNVMNSNKDLEQEQALISRYMKVVPSGIYTFKSILSSIKKEYSDKALSEYVLKQFFQDEEMKKILQVLFLENLNVSKASKELYMHRNTLNYKLDRFYEVTGFDVRHFNDACFIQGLI